jgi:hypothetical protein
VHRCVEHPKRSRLAKAQFRFFESDILGRKKVSSMDMRRILLLLQSAIPVILAARAKGRNVTLFCYGSLLVFTVAGVWLVPGAASTYAFYGIFVGLFCAFLLWMSRGVKKQSEGARQKALLVGLQVEEVTRDLPHVASRDKSVTLKPGTTTRYSLKRRVGASPKMWAFLMRSVADGAQYPNGWLFRSADGSPSDSMKVILTDIATNVDEEYLEFEGSPERVSAFWDEWGGEEQVEKVNSWLEGLAAL